MATPGVPQILSPQDGSALINHRLPMVVRKTPFASGGYPFGTTASVAAATNVEDIYGGGTGAFPSWTLAPYLSTGNGTQAQMAKATIDGSSNVVNWYGVSYASVAAQRCVGTARLQFGAMSTWAQPPNMPGESTVRCVVSYLGLQIATVSAMWQDAKWTGGTATVQLSSFDIYAALTTLLGKNWTMGQLQTLLNEGSATNASFKVQVANFNDEDGYATGIYAGPVSLMVQYFTSTQPDLQGSFQMQASVDAFSTFVWDSGRIYTGDDAAVVPPLALPGGATDLRFRVMVWNQAGTASPWSSAGGASGSGGSLAAQTVSVATLSTTGSALLLNENALRVFLYEFEFARWFEASAWSRRTAGSPTTQYVYQATFDRSLEPTRNFWLSGFEEDGTPVAYTEKTSIADVDATAASFYWDEAANLLYVHTSDGRSPAAYKSRGMPALVIFPIATEDWRTGPGELYMAEGRVKDSSHSIAEEIPDLSGGGVFGVPSGSVTLHNGDGLFNTLISGRDRAYGWLASNRRCRIKMLGVVDGQRVAYADAVPMLDGIFAWDKATLMSRTDIRLEIRARAFRQRTFKLAKKKLNKKKFKTIEANEDGEFIPEVIGVGHKGRKLHVVETWGALKPGKKVAAVTSVYANGNPVLGGTSTWSYNVTRGLVIFVSQAAFDAAGGKNADWTWDGSGEQFKGSDVKDCPTLVRYYLYRAGVPDTDIVTSTFDAIKLSPPSSIFDVTVFVDRETMIGDLIKNACTSGNFNLVCRADGKFIAVPDRPTGWSANTIVLDDTMFEIDPQQYLYDGHMASVVRVNYHYFTKKGGNDKRYTRESDTSGPTYGVDGETVVESTHSTEAGASAVADALDFERPHRHLKLRSDMRAWSGILGGTVALNVTDAMSPSGALSWALFQIRRRQTTADGDVELTLRWIEDLDILGRPL